MLTKGQTALALALTILLGAEIGGWYQSRTKPLPQYPHDHAEKAIYYDCPSDGEFVWCTTVNLYTAFQDKDWLLAFATLLIGAFTGTLWWTTLKLWNAGEKQRELMEDTAHRQLRAYVHLEDIYFLYAEDKTSDGVDRTFTDATKLRFKNYGQTPAFNVSIWIHRIPGRSAPDGFNPIYELAPHHVPLVLAPSQRFSTRIPIEKGYGHKDSFGNRIF